ncbi:bucentaur or craniofacial development-domain-containing protein [Lentinula edodes]|uniref:bucentaur or craniofacial development-domain-containing protein n=1 Tax=Lentinula edodes TaxID=5353 RepID=UPI001E8D154E|nr:bucentaur or craniofacial development-domain-containing protein [Lentinula edodes]KAH7869078.1 bucentaur or craniofacial development-domain-containing protein [Lentinula edodes]
MLNSDSEDEEYVPDEKADKSSTSSDSEPEAKRPRTELPEPEDPETQQRKRQQLWKAFKESVTSGKDAVDSQATREKQNIVRVEKRYIFAGKEIRRAVEVAEVPADSDEAKKWPRISPELTSASISSPANDSASDTIETTLITSATTSGASSSFTQTSQKPSGPKRGPRRSKITLGEIPGTLRSARPTKLTTLEKSAMDWRSHVSEQDNNDLKDELEANRKQGGGGYLEKVEFLERVSERRESLLDSSKSGKRRRG